MLLKNQDAYNSQQEIFTQNTVFQIVTIGNINKVMPLKVFFIPGNGKIQFSENIATHNFESATNAYNYFKIKFQNLGISSNFYHNKDIYINISKENNCNSCSSLAIFMSLMSLITRNEIKTNIAFIGEISFSGKVRMSNDIAQNFMLMNETNITKVFIPNENFIQLPRLTVKKTMQITPIKHVDEILSGLLKI